MKKQPITALTGVPSDQLKQAVLQAVYESKHIEVCSGYQLLAAKHVKTNVGIYVVDGNFGREHYKKAIEEANAAGLNASRVYAYGKTATYSGQSICFCKFEEIGLKLPLVPAQLGAGAGDESSLAEAGTGHPDAAQPIVALKCVCCGARFQGRQFSNQDIGWGLGNCCVERVSKTTDSMKRTYGVDGVHYNLQQPGDERSSEANPGVDGNDRLFSGVYPTGIVYADRAREVGGDYARLAYLNFATLKLEVEANCPADLRQRIELDAAVIQAKRGQQFQTSTAGQAVLLGSARC